jgi:calcium-dependent protein kinase
MQPAGDIREIQVMRASPRRSSPRQLAGDSPDALQSTDARLSGERRAKARRADAPIKDLYDIEEEKIGQGTFGIVCAARQKETGCLRAVKVIQKSRVKDLKQLKREVVNMHGLDHPNIVKLYESFEDTTTVQLVLEICGGGELFHAITKVKRFAERETSIIMAQMLRAVQYLHGLHICHRDLKPENFLFLTTSPVDKNVLKLIDFGLSCQCKPQQVLKEVVGTTSYVAPQVLQRHYNTKCDLWSCGIIMYILLCGHPPFRGKVQQEILLKVRDGSFVFDAKVWRTVTLGAKHLISMLLRKEPEERYTADQALADRWLLATLPKEWSSAPTVGGSQNLASLDSGLQDPSEEETPPLGVKAC